MLKHTLILVLMLLCIGPVTVSARPQYGHKDYYKRPVGTAAYISPTQYDWSAMADSLTREYTSDYERIHAIYVWVTRNIAYDTSHSINTADACLDSLKGVCQGYCELFHRIAGAAGLRTEIVFGEGRNDRTDRHAWIFAYTRENHGILLDPTWGAGIVSDSTFTFRNNPDIWFNVDPEWMILSHLPDNPAYQLIKKPVSPEEFASLDFPYDSRIILEYGVDAHLIYKQVRNHTLSLPILYSGGEDRVLFTGIPLQERLCAGKRYTFRLTILQPCEVVLNHNGDWYRAGDGVWTDEGNGVFSITFSPEKEGFVVIGVMDGGMRMTCLVEYPVDAA